LPEKPPDSTRIFRQEALEHSRQGQEGEGDVLRISPDWIPWAYRLVVALTVAGILFLCLGKMHDYAAGPAVVRASGRTDLTSLISATVHTVAVAPGQAVAAGQVLVEFDSAEEQAVWERYNREYEIQLANSLRNPLDSASKKAVASLSDEREYARQRLEVRRLRAPHAGVVGDVRTRPGLHMLPGQLAVTLWREDPDLTVVAVLPGHFRPQLEAGMPARLELSGYPHAFQALSISTISDEIIGPSEARRFLGQEIADAIPVHGPGILVEAVLPHPEFEAAGRSYPYFDGMHAVLEARVESEPIILKLVPGLKVFWGGKDD